MTWGPLFPTNVQGFQSVCWFRTQVRLQDGGHNELKAYGDCCIREPTCFRDTCAGHLLPEAEILSLPRCLGRARVSCPCTSQALLCTCSIWASLKRVHSLFISGRPSQTIWPCPLIGVLPLTCLFDFSTAPFCLWCCVFLLLCRNFFHPQKKKCELSETNGPVYIVFCCVPLNSIWHM